MIERQAACVCLPSVKLTPNITQAGGGPPVVRVTSLISSRSVRFLPRAAQPGSIVVLGCPAL